MTDDDAALVRLAASGDEAAFAALVRRHTDAVWRLAYGSLRERTAAEDAVQETFIKAYRALPGFRGDASFRTWVLSIANRVCLDQVRRRRVELAPLEEALVTEAGETDPATRIALEMAVEALPEDERTAFVLVDAMGLSREEAAAIVGVPASTLKSRLARAHDRLVEAMGGARKRAGRKA